jgi:hypothetical protein
MPRSRTLTGLCACVALAVVVGLGSAGASSAAVAASPGPPNASRMVMARIYQGGRWVIPGETPQTVAAALAKLEPTYVSSLLRFQAGENVTAKEVADFNTVRDAVLATSPEAKFSIELNALEYPSASKMKAMMATVRKRFDNDGWLFDFYTPAAEKNPDVMEAAVGYAHANGEFLGGNAFGIDKHPKIPDDTDFLAVQDYNFQIDLGAVRDLAKRTTVFFHLGNSPGFANSDGCRWIEDFSSAKRKAYLARRASQQDQYNFRFSYPTFFPECARKRSSPNPILFAYNFTNDEAVSAAIGGLLDRYEPAS